MPEATIIIFQIAILVMSVVVHEVSHGVAALFLGDKTAKYAGRLTLNPIPHIDPFGSVLLPLLLVVIGSPFLIGWAKPVPYNPYNLMKSPKWGPGIVAAAGPLSNLSVAVIFGLILRLGIGGVFSFLSPEFIGPFLQIITYIIVINIVLAVFNLVPIPPLDGSKVLFTLLPYRALWVQEFLESWGFVILIIFIVAFSGWIGILTSLVFNLIVGTNIF